MTRVGVVWEKRRRLEDDAAISIARFPTLDRTRLRAGAPEGAVPAGRVRPARPLARREKDERTIAGWWTGSGIVHAAILFAALYLMTPKGPPSSPEPPTVEMVFGHAGSAGLQGASVPQAQQGANAPPVENPQPAKPEELEPPEPLLMVPPAPPLPAMPTPVSPTPESAPPAQRLEETRSARPARSAQRTTRSNNPFANLTDLSLAPSPHIERPGRGGSGAAINLSLGPMVQGGRLAMPFSMRGGKGMSSDYQEMIDDWVEAHKYYPESAARRGHDGNVTIHVTWNRDGRVLDVQLESGSGDDDLDDAWTGLFRGAHLPAPPPDVKGDPISMDMTMHFILTH